jgi:hypothetical protein
MNKLIIGAAVLVTTAFSFSAANAWVCRAQSRTGWGVGTAPYLASAKVIALNYCAAHTPRGMLCVITRCVR